ncbi:MAG: TetR/AcrR family transcriptional regulator [Sphingomonadales bacterium]|nr:TetR/AcrR family transcriptional regulator [Sphingomonadales bacterium]
MTGQSQGRHPSPAAPQTARPRKRRAPAELRRRLLAAAGGEFEAQGYSRTTTAAIARRAEVSEAQLFRYFDSKAALFRAAIFEPLNAHFAAFDDRQRAAAGSYREDARGYIVELQDFMAQHSRMLMSLVVAEAYDRGATGGLDGLEGLATYFERGRAMMARRMGADAANARVRPEVMVRVSFAAVLASALFGDWIYAGSGADAGEIEAAVTAFVLDGLNANPAT